MPHDRYVRLKELLLAVMDLNSVERRAYLDEVCRNDAEMAGEIDALLMQDVESRRFEPMNTDPSWGLPSLRTPAEDDSADPDLMVGRCLSHYRITGLLGQGGMGVVYKAEDTRLLRPVALKFLRRRGFEPNDPMQDLVQEAQAAAALEHPNICTIYAIEEVDKWVFIAMALVDGCTLRQRLGECPLDVAGAIAITTKIAEGLAAAHAQNVVHLDIKPSNIMLTSAGAVKVLDFGLARSVGLAGRTGSDLIAGTLSYMSPEQTRGQHADHRSDIWSLGVVLYEMVTGTVPFDGESQGEVLDRIQNATYLPPTDIRPELPTDVSKIVATALAKDREARYADIGEMLRDLLTLQERLRLGSGRSTLMVPPGLPCRLTTFVGRTSETAEILELMATTRLLTLLGVGGVGKTSLSLRVGEALRGKYPDGVWFVELAGLTDASFVSRAVTAALGIREEYGRPLDDTIVEALRDTHLLLILDNCEHLVEACAFLADRLLIACPDLSILATSREALDIHGERIYAVPPLALPSSDERAGGSPGMLALAKYDAIALFIERATAVRPGFTLSEESARTIARLCRRLDGIPLAIELAAACLKALSVDQIAVRLDNRFDLLTNGGRTTAPRHQTLRAAIEWSYDLLNDMEREVLACLSVFAGGCTLDAIEIVWADKRPHVALDGIDAPRALDQPGEMPELLNLLSNLVSKSLVILDDRTDPPRYRQLETIRQYAWDRLGESRDQERLRRAHMSYFLRLAEEMEPGLSGAEQLGWMNRVEDEQDNIRGALEWSSRDSVRSGLRLASALVEYWFNRDLASEGVSHLLGLLSNPEAAGQSLDRAKALNVAGSLLAWTLADYDTALPLVHEALEIGRRICDPLTIGRAELVLGIIAVGGKDLPTAREHLEGSLRIMQSIRRDDYLGDIHHHLGNAALLERDYQLAQVHFDHAHEQFLLAGHRNKVAGTLRHRANVALALGDIPCARSQVLESLRMNRELKSDYGVLSCLVTIAAIRTAEGEYKIAARLLGAMGARMQDMRLHLYISDAIECEAVKDDLRGRIGQSELEGALAEGHLLSMDEAVALGAREG